jgi:hypothetical protein
MKCLHCLVEFHPEEHHTILGDDADGGWAIKSATCPACSRDNLFLLHVQLERVNPAYGPRIVKTLSEVPIRPRGASRPPCPREVPPLIAEDYAEACLVLPDSSKASAALSRRCLQNLLREAAKVKQGDLSNEIQQVIDSRTLPTHLVDMIDAVRNTGNFAAHPIKSQRTGEILPVEPAEAEWNLDVLEALFDFYYVQPTAIAKKRAALDAKLVEAGKKPMK